MLPFIDTIINGVETVLDKIIPDANVREQVKSEIRQASFEWAKLENADRESARQREMAVKDATPRQLAWMFVGGYFGVLAAVLFYGVPTDQQRIFDVLLGMLGAAVLNVVGYYFGASHGVHSNNHAQ